MKYVVAAADEIPPGGRKILTLAGRSIGIFNVDGNYFALVNRCVHQGGPVCNGKVLPKLSAVVLPDGEVKEVLSPETVGAKAEVYVN